MRQGDGSAGSFKWIVSAVGLSLFAYSIYRVGMGEISTEWILLGLVTVLVVSRIDIGIPRTSSTMTLSDTFVFVSVLLYGPYPSVVLAGVDAAMCTTQYRNRRSIIWFNVAVVSFSIFISNAAVTHIFGDPTKLTSNPGRLVMAAGALALCHYMINSGLVSVLTSIREGAGILSTWRESFLWTSLSYFAGAIAACLVVKLIHIISFYAFIIAVPILTITYFTYRIYLDKVEASNQYADDVADLHLRTIEALAIAIDAKDEVTHDHVRRVQIYSTGLARLFGLSEPEIEALKAGALLHDIGKLAVPDYILNKPGPLTRAEFEKMKVHTVVGAEILERVGFPYPVVPVVRHHHERWDGRGYPDGLLGDQIPMTARILTVADSFDAMREARQYRAAMTREEAIAVLREGSGSVFDPQIVAAFLDHLDEFEAEIRSQGVETRNQALFSERRTQTGSLVQNEPRPFERIRSAHREVIAMYGIAQTIGTSLDLRDTFAVFSSRLCDIVSYTTCVLYLVKQETEEIEAAFVSGRNIERLKGRKLPAGAGIAGWVIANGHPMHNCDPRLDFDAMRAEIGESYRTATVVPLIRDEQTLGALALYSTELRSYDADQLRLVEAVAKLASDAIANAVRHRKTEVTALTDSLTELPNARALRFRFEEEADRARRHRDTFAVVMMDVDGFKSVNDRLGHQAGDHLLVELGRVLQSLLRSSDFVSRYSGDEFVAILHIGADEVKDLLFRIQRSIDSREFGFGGSNLHIGISVGWACYGADGETLDELLLGADRAMYANKAKRKALLSGETGDPGTPDLTPYRVM